DRLNESGSPVVDAREGAVVVGNPNRSPFAGSPSTAPPTDQAARSPKVMPKEEPAAICSTEPVSASTRSTMGPYPIQAVPAHLRLAQPDPDRRRRLRPRNHALVWSRHSSWDDEEAQVA